MAEQSTKIHVPPRGTRGTRAMDVFMRMLRPLAGREVARYQKIQGPEPGKFMGFPVLVLSTVGARSGKERNTVLGGFPDGHDAWLIIASKGGSATHPAWLHNIARHPTVSGRRLATENSKPGLYPSWARRGRTPTRGL